MNHYGVKCRLLLAELGSQLLWFLFIYFSSCNPDRPGRVGLRRGLHHATPWALLEPDRVSAVPRLWGTLSGQPQGLCGQVRHEGGPGPELPLWQRRGHPERVLREGFYWGGTLLWRHATGSHLLIVSEDHVFNFKWLFCIILSQMWVKEKNNTGCTRITACALHSSISLLYFLKCHFDLAKNC